MAYKKEMQIGGNTLSLETGAVARQANGAVVVRYGDTVVLATACYKQGNVIGDFMPLTVDYKEYTYAGGRIPGGFFKREGRPTAKTTPTSSPSTPLPRPWSSPRSRSRRRSARCASATSTARSSSTRPTRS